MLALACLHTHSPYVYPSISMSVSHQLLHVFVGGWIQVHEPVRVVAAHGQVLVHHLRGLPDVELFDPEEPEEEVVRVDRGFVESEVRVLAAAASKLRLLHQPRAKPSTSDARASVLCAATRTGQNSIWTTPFRFEKEALTTRAIYRLFACRATQGSVKWRRSRARRV